MLIQRTTLEERVKNGSTMDQIMYYFFACNITGFKNLLSDGGKFLSMPKMLFLAKLNTKFNELMEEGIKGVAIQKGICVDTLPGCEMYEVRYALSYELLEEEGIFCPTPKSPKRDGEVIIRLAFRLIDGKVQEIKTTKKYIAIDPGIENEVINCN